MADWWNVLASVSRLNAWAQVLSVAFLVLAAGSALLSFKTSARVADLREAQARAAAKAPEVQPATRLAADAAAVSTPPPKGADAPVIHHLPKDQRDRLLATLTASPKGAVSLTYLQDDLDAQALCQDLAKVMAAAGWKTTPLAPTRAGADLKGLHFQIKSTQSEPENAKYLIHGFIEAGLKPNTELNRNVPDNTLLLIVGAR